MNSIWILVIGMVVVVAGVLGLRLHAFLALIAGAVVVAALTPAEKVYLFAARAGMMEVVEGSQGDAVVVVNSKRALAAGTPVVVMRKLEGEVGYERVGEGRIVGPGGEGMLRVEVVKGEVFPMMAGDVVMEPATERSARGAASESIGDRVAAGFGRTALDIGILIAMAAIVGETLLASGAAERIVLSSRRALGDRHVALAFLVSGYLLGIPVFFDTVFYLLIPLAKVMRVRSGKDYALYVMAIVAGATMTHSLVPPTPGPLLVASQFGVGLAEMIAGGLVVGCFTSGAGYLYALWANRQWDIPLRVGLMSEAAEAAVKEEGKGLPSLWLSLTPILLPVVLITARALGEAMEPEGGYRGVMARVQPVLVTLGEKNLALMLAAVIGLLMLFFAQRRRKREGVEVKKTSGLVGEALSAAGVIILITSAGGAFGYVLRQTDIAIALKDALPVAKLSLLPLVFLVTAAVRTAQGSATVAMITAAGIVSPIVAGGGLSFHPVYLALAVGCGSKPIMWMNDSGFWLVGKMAGFTEVETLKTVSVMQVVMAATGLGVVMVGAWWWPGI